MCFQALNDICGWRIYLSVSINVVNHFLFYFWLTILPEKACWDVQLTRDRRRTQQRHAHQITSRNQAFGGSAWRSKITTGNKTPRTEHASCGFFLELWRSFHDLQARNWSRNGRITLVDINRLLDGFVSGDRIGGRTSGNRFIGMSVGYLETISKVSLKRWTCSRTVRLGKLTSCVVEVRLDLDDFSRSITRTSIILFQVISD